MTEPLGITVCRLSLDPARGRIRHQLQVGIAIRAAMFTELTLAGRLVGRRWPEAIGEASTGSPLLDSVHAAVANRRPTPWKRWFSHVDADREAATAQLLESGRWRAEGRRLVDTDAGSTIVEQQRVRQLVALDKPPDDLESAVLVLLLAGSGGPSRPTPRRSRKLTKEWLTPHLTTSGRSGDATLSLLNAAFVAMRRVNPIPLLSR